MNGGFIEMEKSSSVLHKRRKTRRELDRLLNGRLSMRDKRSHSIYELTRNESFSDSSPLDDSDRRAYIHSGCQIHAKLLTYISILLSLCAFISSGVFLSFFFFTRTDMSTFVKEINADLEHRNELLHNLQEANNAFAGLKLLVDQLQSNISQLSVNLTTLRSNLSTFHIQLTLLEKEKPIAQQLSALPKELKDLQQATASLGSSVRDVQLLVKTNLMDRISAVENKTQIIIQSNAIHYLYKLQQVLPSSLLSHISGFKLSSLPSNASSLVNVMLLTEEDFDSHYNFSLH